MKRGCAVGTLKTAEVKIRWWGWLDLNQRPIGYEPTALTAELHPLTGFSFIGVYQISGKIYNAFVICRQK